jgi:hypothetical protein
MLDWRLDPCLWIAADLLARKVPMPENFRDLPSARYQKFPWGSFDRFGRLWPQAADFLENSPTGISSRIGPHHQPLTSLEIS